MKLADTQWGYEIGDEGMMPPSAAAERFGVSPKTLQRWARDGVIRRSVINRRLSLYCVRSIREFIGSHEQ